jgi:predicted O-methyltransferase YrrM
MTPSRAALLKELEKFGAQNDASTNDRQRKMLNITPDTGAFLAVLVKGIKARRVLEIGTSNGYSTIWLADAVEAIEGHVVTVEAQAKKVELARHNFASAGLSGSIDIHTGDAGEFLGQHGPGSFDLVFLDADRDRYIDWWPELQRALASGGLLVVDNAVSHAVELQGFVDLVAGSPGFSTVLVPIGNGEYLALKESIFA